MLGHSKVNENDLGTVQYLGIWASISSSILITLLLWNIYLEIQEIFSSLKSKAIHGRYRKNWPNGRQTPCYARVPEVRQICSDSFQLDVSLDSFVADYIERRSGAILWGWWFRVQYCSYVQASCSFIKYMIVFAVSFLICYTMFWISWKDVARSAFSCLKLFMLHPCHSLLAHVENQFPATETHVDLSTGTLSSKLTTFPLLKKCIAFLKTKTMGL